VTLLDAGSAGAIVVARAPSFARERFERIYTILRDRICLLGYPPRTRLSDEELAEEFATSRTPVRRVLARLQDEGLLESRHGVGTIVTDVRLEQLTQVFHLRMELAVLIGRLSPLPRSPADLARMHALLDRCDAIAQSPDHESLARLNMDFARELAAMTGNAPLREINDRLYYQAARIWLLTVPRLNLIDEVAIFRREMADIVVAAEIGDLEAVGHIRRSHISMSFTRMMRYAGRRADGAALR
jgi:DNA-binding GntR family transcriptional regulator